MEIALALALAFFVWVMAMTVRQAVKTTDNCITETEDRINAINNRRPRLVAFTHCLIVYVDMSTPAKEFSYDEIGMAVAYFQAVLIEKGLLK